MEKEIWKDIPGYEGVYQASNLGRIRGLDRTDISGRKWRGKILTQCVCKGYKKVGLNHNRVNKQYFVHRLVALAFLPKPEGYDQINHKDENPFNNKVENLEWCDYLYNRNFGSRNEKAAISQSKRLKGIIPKANPQKPAAKISTASGEILETFVSASEAARKCGLSESKISMACRGLRNTAGGYKWKYLNE